MSWTDVVGVKVLVSRDGQVSVSRGARCEVCGPARCGFASNEFPVGLSLSLQGGSLNGGVSYKACHRLAMSPCPVVGVSCVSRVYLQ